MADEFRSPARVCDRLVSRPNPAATALDDRWRAAVQRTNRRHRCLSPYHPRPPLSSRPGSLHLPFPPETQDVGADPVAAAHSLQKQARELE